MMKVRNYALTGYTRREFRNTGCFHNFQTISGTPRHELRKNPVSCLSGGANVFTGKKKGRMQYNSHEPTTAG